jgi:hypothetical protein
MSDFRIPIDAAAPIAPVDPILRNFLRDTEFMIFVLDYQPDFSINPAGVLLL